MVKFLFVSIDNNEEISSINKYKSNPKKQETMKLYDIHHKFDGHEAHTYINACSENDAIDDFFSTSSYIYHDIQIIDVKEKSNL